MLVILPYSSNILLLQMYLKMRKAEPSPTSKTQTGGDKKQTQTVLQRKKKPNKRVDYKRMHKRKGSKKS